MPITYKLAPNALTSPPSFGARPAPQRVLGFKDISRQVNLHNPTIPEVTAESVLRAFADETITQLASGNSINLEGFVSLAVSLPVRLDAPTDPLPPDSLDVKMKSSKPLKDQIRQSATYSRIPYIEKTPVIISAADSNTNTAQYIREGYGFAINGSNIGFDASDDDQGVWLLSPAGNYIKQTNVSLNNPSNSIVTIILDTVEGPAEESSVENTLIVRSKYTDNGQLRIGEFSKKVRSIVIIRLTANKTFFVVGDASIGPVSTESYFGPEVDGSLVAIIRPDGVLTLSTGLFGGDQGQAIEVSGTGVVALDGLGSEFEVNVLDYDTLYANVLSYGRYMQEFFNMVF